MGAKDQKRLAVVESRWKPWSERPHTGEVFVGRRNAEVFPALWIMGREFGRVEYYNDPSTILGSAYDIFTHWLPVGEAI